MSRRHTPVRIALVNDYEIVVTGLASVLAPYAERVTVVELDSRLPVISDVDVVLYDTFGQAQGDSIDFAALLGDTDARVVVFSWNTAADLVERALHAGAAAYIAKSVSAEELVAALERVHDGERVTPLAVPERSTSPVVRAPPPDSDRFGRWPGDELGLTAREAEVLALVCQGLSNEEITERAFIGINTVKTHIRTLYRKIGVTSRSQAVGWGLTHGFGPDRARWLPEEPTES